MGRRHPRPPPLPRRGVPGHEAVHQRRGLRQRQRDALPGEGVHVPRGVPHQQHGPGHAPGDGLPQRPRTGDRAPVGGRVGGEVSSELPQPGQVLGERGPPRGEQRHPQQVVGHRGQVGLDAVPEAHLHLAGPRRRAQVGPQPVPARQPAGRVHARRHRLHQPSRRCGHELPDPGVQPVGPHHPPVPRTAEQHVVGPDVELAAGVQAPVGDGEPGVLGRCPHRGVQDGAPHPAAGARERGLRPPARGGDVVDAGEHVTGRVHPERLQPLQPAGHESLPARLVDHPRPPVEHVHRHPHPVGGQRRREPGRTAADHEQVGPRGAGGAHGVTLPRAASSTAMRCRSRTALARVNTPAVHRAPPASGRAAPSATTAR